MKGRGVHKTHAQLADGRDIFFYDDAATPRVIQDTRVISPTSSASELRYDPLLREWVAVSAIRQNRTHLPAVDQCPLCPSTPQRATEIPQEDYDVVVFENRFPSFSGNTPVPKNFLDEVSAIQEVSGIIRPGLGRCEVMCFTSDHSASLTELGAQRLRTVLDAWADRTEALLAIPGIEQVYCFENRGEEIGVTLHHPHGQIYGYPFITPRTQSMLAAARDYRSRRGRELFADILDAEHTAQIRILAVSEHWTAFVPAWARWPVELQVYPHRHIQRLPELSAAERDDFAALYAQLLSYCDRLFSQPLPYISGWQQAPASVTDGALRLHLQLISIRRSEDKLKYLAGSESGMGAFVNDIAPETLAQRLRDIGDGSSWSYQPSAAADVPGVGSVL